MISTDRYLDRTFHPRDYNCVHFACEVWKALTGQDLSSLLNPGNILHITKGMRGKFTTLEVPRDPCIVLMKRPRVSPHMGVFLRGKVLHLHEYGVEFQPVEIASRGFRTVRFYAC